MGRRANHRTRLTYIGFEGELKTLEQWCKKLNLNYQKAFHRLFQLNWDIDIVLNDVENKITAYEGQEKKLVDWCDLFDLDLETTCRLVFKDKTLEDIIKEKK